MASSLIAALVLSSSLVGPSSHLGADAFSPSIGSASGSTSSAVQRASNAAAALHLSNRPPGPSADSIVSVYGGNGGGASNSGDGNKRRRSGRNGNNKRRSTRTAGTPSPSQSKGKKRNSKNQSARRNTRNDSPNRQPSEGPVKRSAAETAKSREQHLALRSKLEEMQHRNGQGEELSRELVHWYT